MPIEDIAKQINRTVGPVQKFIDKENLKMRDMTDSEHLLVQLRDRYYYKELNKQFTDALCTMLNHPRKCPHDHKIPKGECCENN